MPLRLSVTSAALTLDPREAIQQARQLGFDGLVFDAYSAGLDFTSLSATGRREFQRLLSSTQISLVALRADLGPKGFGPGADVDRMLSKLRPVLETSVALGSGVVCVDLGPLPAPAMMPIAKPKVTAEQAGLILLPTTVVEPDPQPATPPPDPAVVSQIDAALAELGGMADRYSATVAFSSSLAGFAALERAISSVRCPWFGLDLDPIALLRDAWPVDEVFSRLGGLVRHVRGRDAVSGSEGRTKPAILARGDVKWRELLDALDGAAYGGWITIDPMELTDRKAAAVMGLKQMKAFLE